MFVQRATIEGHGPDIYRAIPAQFRDQLPADATADAQNTLLFRKGFTFLQSFVDRLFQRLEYEEGTPWPMWKLVAAFYMVQEEVGPETLRRVGAQIFRTMPWPPDVRCFEDAIRTLDAAYRASHHDTPASLVGGWPVLEDEKGRILLENSTPYPCYLEHGTVLGICDAFSDQTVRCELLAEPQPKREGGIRTLYELVFEPMD